MNNRDAFEWMARAGYAARGVVFVIIGVLSALAASGARSKPAGTQGALQTLFESPFGGVILCLIAAGLAGFAAWRLMQSLFDADGLGRDRRGLMRRVGYLGGGLFHLGLAVWALSFIFLGSGDSDEDHAARDWTAWLLNRNWGAWIVIAVGAGFVIGGVAIFFQGCTRRFQDRLKLDHEPRRWVVMCGRVGFAARGALFVMVGVFLVIAGVYSDAGEAHGLGGALRELQRQPYGWATLGALAAALLAYGVFEFAQAIFRRVRPPSAAEAKREVREAVAEAKA